jgi:hypothetical protein
VGEWQETWDPTDAQVASLSKHGLVVFGPGPRTWTVDSPLSGETAFYEVLSHEPHKWHLRLKKVVS